MITLVNQTRIWRRIMRYWTYFRRGHNVYLMFLLSFMNFIVIQYRLLIENIPLLHELLPKLWIFAVAVVITYTPIAIIVGWLDYQKGSVVMDNILSARASPWVIDCSKALILIAEGKTEDAKKLMEKWIK